MTKGTTYPALILLNANKDKVLKAVPQTLRAALTWERIIQAVGMALAKSDKLRECDPQSVYVSVLDIVGLGLDPAPGLGLAYLVPFKGQCTALIGAQGKIELAYRSGMIEKINVQVVYSGDDVEIDLAAGTVRHTLTMDDLLRIAKDGRGEPLAVYALVQVKGAGSPTPEVMTWADFKKIQKAASDRTGGKLSPAYKEWPEEMARRSCLNRALKRAPKSRDLMDVLSREMELEDDDEGGTPARGDVIDAATALPDHGEPESIDQVNAELAKRAQAETVDANPPFANNGAPKADTAGEMP